MERKLYEASLGGNITSLMELLEEDPLILDRVITSFSETPLHIAAMYGHLEFAAKILSLKPELTSELDSQGFSPLHLASARKNVDMVKLLVDANPDVCTVMDHDGRTPLHLAAMKGRVEVMKVLIQTRPQAIQVRLDRGETILHLCVKYNRFEALQLLLEQLVGGVTDEDSVSVNSKDNDGNTILHLAVAKKQMKTIKHLLNNNIGVDGNALNNNGLTALDILTQSERDLKDMEIADLLREARVLRAASIMHLAESGGGMNHDQTEHQPSWGQSSRAVGTNMQSLNGDQYNDKRLKEKQNTLMVVASLIATMAFQGAVNPPGGFWQDDNGHPTSADEPQKFVWTSLLAYSDTPSPAPSPTSSHAAGTSIMAYKYPSSYGIYMGCITIGFFASLMIIFLLISGLPLLKRKPSLTFLMGILWVAITSMAIGYLVAWLATDAHPELIHMDGLEYFWVTLVGLVLLLHFVRISVWLLVKFGILKKREGHS